MKQALTVAALCLILSFPIRAAATDFYYSGELNPATGAPMVSDSYQNAQPAQIELSDSMYYDRAANMFVYPVGNGVSEVRSNAADGMILTEPVTLRVDSDVSLTVYRNGEALQVSPYMTIAEAGQYSVSIHEGGGMENLFGFTIVGSRTNLPGGYAMPDGFYITDATVNGEEAEYDRTYIGMQEEGLYHIEYISPAADLRLTLETTVDRTPPEIFLNGVQDMRGRFHSAVQVEGLQDGDTVALTRDGEQANFPYDGRITDTGVYTLQAYDSVGNSMSTQFAILLYFDLNSLAFIGLACLSVVGVVLYIQFKRRRLKII